MSIPVGTHMLHAVGIAWAMKQAGENVAVLTFFGEGATSEGDFSEAMNMAGVFQVPVVFFCQNNQYAISLPFTKQTASPTVAQKALAYGMFGVQVDGNDVFAVYRVTAEALDRARTAHEPTLIEAHTYRVMDHTTSDDARRYREESEVEPWRKRDPIERLARYMRAQGLLDDAAAAEALADADRQVAEAVAAFEAIPPPGPEELFAHVYADLTPPLAEQKAELLARLAEEAMSMARLNMVEAIDQALSQEMELDATVVVLGEDVGRDGGVFRVTDGLVERFGEKRVIDTPLAESGIVGMAIGMAIAGYRPVAEIQFSGFAYPAYDQLVCHAARMRNRSRGQFTVPLVVRMPYGGGIRALEHHSESMEAVFAHVPGLKVVIPADPYEAKGLLASAVRDPDPVVFIEPARVYRAIKTEVPEEPYTLPLGKARLVREGGDVTVLAWGAHVRTVKEAAAAPGG